VTIELIGCSAPYVEAIEQRIHDRFGAEVDHPDVVMVLCGTEGRWALLDDEIATNSRVVVAVLPELLLEDYIRALSAGASGVVYVDTSSAITVDVISAAVNGEVVLPLQAAHNMAVLAKRLKPSTDLTPPEVELLRAVAAGRTIVELARETYFSERTVRRHLQSLYLKLGVQNRAEAIAAAARLDIAD
jgi:DNA-binding NarL/FixJ family response regulator